MPPWNQFKAKYELEVQDLPNPALPNVFVVERLDSEEAQNSDGEKYTRHNLFFAGIEYPLRLNNTRIDIIQNLHGEHTENAVGKKLALIAGANTSFGKSKIGINIHPFPVPEGTPPVAIPASIAAKNPFRRQTAQHYGVQFLAENAALPPSPAAATTAVNENAVLGPERAAAIMVNLRARGKTWDDLCKHLAMHGLGQFVQGRTPPEAGLRIADAVKSYMAGFPRTVEVVDPSKEAAVLVKSWAPKPPERKPAINTATGETDLPPDDDIPF